MKSLKPRLLTAVIGIPVVLLVIFLSELWHPFVRIIVGIATSLMICEYLHAKQLLKNLALSIPCIVFACALSVLITTGYVHILLYALFLAVFLVIIIKHETLSYAELAYAISGTLLISFCMSAISFICTNDISVSFFFVLTFLLPWMADAGGFFIGASLGRHKLCPKISPKKTVEGAIGGILFCMLSAVAMGFVFTLWILPGSKVNFYALMGIGAIDAVLSIVGDLSFSLIKRSLGIKDYGSIFPGHGGFLDRFDSIIFTAPAAVILGQFVPYITLG